MNLVTWNKNHKFAINTIDRINSVIYQTNPDIMYINEFNFNSNQDQSLINIPGYNIEYDKLLMNIGICRSAMYIRKGLKYTRFKKYENESDSSIVIKIGYPNQKKIHIYGIYRQWSLLNKKNEDTKNIHKQEERWIKTIDKIQKVISENTKTFILGDINVNTLSF